MTKLNTWKPDYLKDSSDSKSDSFVYDDRKDNYDSKGAEDSWAKPDKIAYLGCPACGKKI